MQKSNNEYTVGHLPQWFFGQQPSWPIWHWPYLFVGRLIFCPSGQVLIVFCVGDRFLQLKQSLNNPKNIIRPSSDRSFYVCRRSVNIWIFQKCRSADTNWQSKIDRESSGIQGRFLQIGWWTTDRRITLRWYGTPIYCGVFPIKINIKIKHNFIILFFPEILTLQRIAQWPTFIIWCLKIMYWLNGGWVVQGSNESRIIYTLAKGAKNWKLLVRRDLQGVIGRSFIKVSFIMYTTCILYISTSI